MIDTNAVELVWTGVALTGVAIHVRGIRSAWRDRQAVLVTGADRILDMLAMGRVRGEAIRVGVDLAFAGVGVWAMFQIDPPTRTVGSYLVAGVFIGAVALLVLNGLLDDRERVRLREHVARRG